MASSSRHENMDTDSEIHSPTSSDSDDTDKLRRELEEIDKKIQQKLVSRKKLKFCRKITTAVLRDQSTQTERNPHNTDRGNDFCRYCIIDGHTIEVCRKLQRRGRGRKFSRRDGHFFRR